MKRILCLAAFFIFTFCGCGEISGNNETLALNDNYSQNLSADSSNNSSNKSEFSAAWLSYLEIAPPSGCRSQSDYEKYICSLLENLTKLKIKNLFVQVRAFADAIYPSKLFPSSAYVCTNQGDELPFDFFQLIIDCAKNYDISVSAWINPYRIQKEYDKDKLSDESTAKKWLLEKSENVIKAAGGLYFNPASEEVTKLIVDGVREILENYDILGIHIDDYFYPSTDESIDKNQFEKYQSSGGKMTLTEWRRENVSSLVAQIYSTVKAFGNDKIFSISPNGDIEKNKNEYYADVELWCSQEGFCDMIIPQIYFGFENEKMPFEACCKKWKEIIGCDVTLCAGLALYKSGKEDAYAGSGKDEWKTNNDIISRQVEFLRDCGFDGFCLYSASFVNFNENSLKNELQNLLNVI